MNSRIYVGEVMHHRSNPVKHTLKYPLYFYAFDLNELDDLQEKVKLFSYNKFNLVSLRDKDYLRGEGSINQRIRHFLNESGVKSSITRIDLITSGRYFNYVFNPVSFYYCYQSDNSLVAVIAEVNNTFGEKHLYMLTKPKGKNNDDILEFKQTKEFHVSPFNDLTGHYIFKFSKNTTMLDIKITLVRDNATIMLAHLSGKAHPFTSSNLRNTVIKFPITVFLSIPRIYKEAFKLFFFKKLKYIPKPNPSSYRTIGTLPATIFQRAAMRSVKSVFRKISNGFLEVIYPDGNKETFGDKDSESKAEIVLTNYRFFTRILLSGDIGFGESFMNREWDSPNPVNLIRFFIEKLNIDNENHIAAKTAGHLLNRLTHKNKKNTISGSKENISAHYDLGNDFFREFLDETLLYSCGIFKNKNDTLKKSQFNKIHEILKQANIGPEDHVLEIGSGWGGFAIEAVKRTGCKVTTITLSQKQFDYVTSLIRKEKLDNNITVQLKDYRHLTGEFDKIVSIEMLEAIGYKNFGSFFSTIEKLLKPEGIATIQVITIPDHHFEDYRKRIDWIQKYIFPGGLLPSVTALSVAMTKNSKFYIENLINIGPHYATTLKEWRKKFTGAQEKLLKIGYGPEFQRMWLYYFYVCEAGFASRILNDVIITFTRQGNLSLYKTN